MKVTVAEGLQVAHDGVVYPAGSTAEVPDDVGASWVRSGWVTDVAEVQATAVPEVQEPPAGK